MNFIILERMTYQKIIISRTDSIGDVILTLPLAGYLKKCFPQTKIVFFGKSYTKAVVAACKFVDEFLNYDDFQKLNRDEQTSFLQQVNADVIVHVFPRKDIAHSARKAQIPIRIGTSHRFYHWTTCNKTVNFSRKKSALHEAQLNFKLLTPLDIKADLSIEEIVPFLSLSSSISLPQEILSLLDINKTKVILHPKSQGSAVEWGVAHFASLASLLIDKGFQVIVTGTAKEKEMIADSALFQVKGIVDLTGKLSLEELMTLINTCDALIAASTGPLHIASAMNKKAIGLYSERRPIHPGRWMPIGANASYLSKSREGASDKELDDLIKQITPEEVLQKMV
jgi:heptosyltransferase-3